MLCNAHINIRPDCYVYAEAVMKLRRRIHDGCGPANRPMHEAQRYLTRRVSSHNDKMTTAIHLPYVIKLCLAFLVSFRRGVVTMTGKI